MDLITHIVITRKLVGRSARVVAAGVLADAPFYLTYPTWLIARGKLAQAVVANEWPDPPGWMATLHHAFHSFPVLLCGAVIVRTVSGRWPREELTAWGLHILIDIPTHSRRRWGPQFVWPLSDVAVDGVSWAEGAAGMIARLLRAR
ncbi:MAG TPA: hypothetical protein VF897_09245 [Roseiflexaceae bacterium]